MACKFPAESTHFFGDVFGSPKFQDNNPQQVEGLLYPLEIDGASIKGSSFFNENSLLQEIPEFRQAFSFAPFDKMRQAKDDGRHVVIQRARQFVPSSSGAEAPVQASTVEEVRAAMVEVMRETMMRANNAPHTNESGIWYADDYAANFGYDQLVLNGITNDKYFDLRNRMEFRVRTDKKASEALEAFLAGLSIADCGNVVQACLYKALLAVLGEERFNALFGGPITPLTITQLLFHGDVGHSSMHGNPLVDLFEIPKNAPLMTAIDPDVLAVGDVCHIKGIKNYPYKHPAGAGQGWNLIYIGNNAAGEKLFVGFGPKSFREPRTYDEIRKILIEQYNKPQTQADREVIRAGLASSDLVTKMESQIGELTASDQVGYDAKIEGLYCVTRMRFDLVLKLIHGEKLQPVWIDKDLPEEPIKVISYANDLVLRGLPLENLGNTFENYVPKNAQQERMKTAAQAFVRHVLAPSRDYPVGLMLQGEPGLGKTHIATAVAAECAGHDLKVGFVNIDALNLAYNLEGKRLGGFPGPDFFENYVTGYDVVVVDDMNGRFGIEQDMIKAALDYAMKQNKAVIVTCNEDVGEVLNRELVQSSNLINNPYGFLVTVSGLGGETQRHPWWEQAEESADEQTQVYAERLATILAPEDAMPLAALLSYGGSQSAGAVVTGDSASAAALAGALTALGVSGVRLVPTPYDESGHWRHLDDLDEARLLIMVVETKYGDYDFGSYDQWTKVAMSAHNNGSKLLVVASEKERAKLFAKHGHSLERNKGTRPRVQARMGVMFQGYAEASRHSPD